MSLQGSETFSHLADALIQRDRRERWTLTMVLTEHPRDSLSLNERQDNLHKNNNKMNNNAFYLQCTFVVVDVIETARERERERERKRTWGQKTM